MKFFLDCEFFDRGGFPVDIRPISIALAAEDGRMYSALFQGATEAAQQSDWLRQNVLPQLKGQEVIPAEIAGQIREFVGTDESPEFLASHGAWDWMIMCQCFGGLMSLPEGWPQVFVETSGLGLPRVERVGGAEHGAAADAATLRKAYQVWQGRVQCPRCRKMVAKLEDSPFTTLGRVCGDCNCDLAMDPRF